MSIFRNRLPYTQKNFLRDPNLLPGNIKKDTNIMGVVGSLEASSSLSSQQSLTIGSYTMYYRTFGKAYIIEGTSANRAIGAPSTSQLSGTADAICTALGITKSAEIYQTSYGGYIIRYSDGWSQIDSYSATTYILSAIIAA